MEQATVTLKPLTQPSTVVIKSLGGDVIDDALMCVLTAFGGDVLTNCPHFVIDHPCILDTYVHRPNAQGILDTILILASKFTVGRLSEVLIREVSTEGKRSLRSFLASVKPTQVGKREHILMLSLPVFETFSKRFVSKEEGLPAAPVEYLPIPPLRELIDISQDDSRILALLLKVRILKPTELLCEIIFPDLQKGKYNGGQVDKLMPYVLKHFANVIRSDVYFKRDVQALPFLPQRNHEQRVKASDVFDPRSYNLRKIFVTENVFPIGHLYNDATVLNVLEEIGMKEESNITAADLLQSARKVSGLPDVLTARQKSHAILQHINLYPQKLKSKVYGQELEALLMRIQWVPRLRQKPSTFPSSLPWLETCEEGERYFFKPCELKGHNVTNLIGSVKPVVDFIPSSEIAGCFGWLDKPEVVDVVEHLGNVVMHYTYDEKAYYMALVNEVYSFLSSSDYYEVTGALESSHFEWVWNGDGFSFPSHVIAIKPLIDLTPYVRVLPSEVLKHSKLFTLFGMRTESDPSLLLQVLGLIKVKYSGRSSRFSPCEVRHDLHLAVDILNELACDQLSPELQEKILMPVRVHDNSYVRLEAVERCMYTGEKEWLYSAGQDEEQNYHYIHWSVPSITAERLGVPSLTHRMLDPDELSIGEEFGQEEKLTTRLSRLLEDYKDGLAVLKELVQNADDAGATDVRFLYDERTNEDAMTFLIDDGMKKCQGPALWVYNDATFKDEDFVNITKLNEATKVHDTEKIGKFGLGFNAVYNLTDVPMFVSKNYFVILDPNTSHLRTIIKNKAKPGIRIDLNKGVKNLQTFKNQFKPFNGVFGCDLTLRKEDNSYDGTLFRFPLRTREQAAVSEIRDKCYDEHEMRKLLKMFLVKANSLLLFTQNVFRVGLYFLPKSSDQNLQPLLMFQVNKSLAQGGILRELSFPIILPDTAQKLGAEQKKLLGQSNFLQASSKVKKNSKMRKVKPNEFPESSIAVDLECVFTKVGASFFEISELPSREVERWLIVSSMGDGESLEFAKSDPSLLPSGGVAVQLLLTEFNTFLPKPEDNGTVFCYLPLPIHSGLPVFINGSFAVDSNRRRLQGKLEDDKTCYGEEWNNVLMTDSISTAYLCLLEDLKKILPGDGSYVFHSLWPRAFDVNEHCWSVVKSFYKQIADGTHALFSNGRKWADITQVVFLHPDLRMDPEIGEVSFAVFRNFTKGNDLVIDLPPEVFLSFECCGLLNVIRSKTYDKLRFYRAVFFPNISRVASDLRDVLVLHALNQNSFEFEDLIMNNACVPVSPGGRVLKRPSQLITPDKEASSLFLPGDGRFPFSDGSTFCHPQVLAKLEKLGMKSNDLPWEDVAERAESVQHVNVVDSKAAVKRAKVLLKFIKMKLKREAKCPPDAIVSRICKAEFLPVLEKPSSFPLPWKSEEYRGFQRLLAAPKDIFLQDKRYLVCCTELLVDVDVPSKVAEFLKLNDKYVTTQHVVKQLDEAISTDLKKMDTNGYEEVSRVCTEAYSFLQENFANCTPFVKDFLSTKRFILVEKRFLPANLVAFEVKTDCSPYLTQVPDYVSDSFGKLLKFCGVRKQFEPNDFISCLREIRGQFGENPLDERTLQVVVNVVIQLGETSEESKHDLDNEQEGCGLVFLPDSRRRMFAVADLCYKDCPWMPDDPEELFVHEKIPWSTCKKLGVKTRREGALQYHDVGFPFGQKEELTDRLKRILTGYPGEKEILKELLQNADDGQATEICFIIDPRNHPEERVLNESWKALQGPALCVYNNRPFTNADIEGICNLGKGTKGGDPNKTGQYGIGFNAVYHLTDVPSFRSKGKEIGDVLCVFDPHCKYVARPTDEKPGRMYTKIDDLKTKFPDVFRCYLGDLFPIQNATMFRFPLKSQEMAEESKISRTPVTVQQLDIMMEGLKMELFEVLLFVNNVRKISIAAVDGSGKLVDTYSVEVVMTKKDQRKRQSFADYMKQIGKQAKQKDFLPTSIKVKKCIYSMKLRDSLQKEQTWLIVQQVGFEKPVEESIAHAFKEEKLGMLPRGGVAYLLNDSRSAVKPDGKAYCFLPLPFRTNLPIHINGHFALDHEARRNLWQDEAAGYRSDWNNALLRDVITSCYLTLLDKVRGYIQLPVGQDAAGQISIFSKSEITERLTYYEALFPRYPLEDSYWKSLADSVYQGMSKKEMHLIPVVKCSKQSSGAGAKSIKGSSGVQVTWFAPQDTGKNQTYFNNLEIKGCFAPVPPRTNTDEKERKKREESRIRRKNQFEEMLLETGFNLVALSIDLFDSFMEAGVEVCCVSPLAVMDFYKSFNDSNPLCSIGDVPCPIERSPFKNVKGIIRILKYCQDDDQFLKNLEGLPLLLTQDNYLRVFSESDPWCLCRYCDILPRSPGLFVHKEVLSDVFNMADLKKTPFFRSLDLDTFSSQLHITLPECFCSEDQYVRWFPEDNSKSTALPNRRWIYRVWQFLENFVSEKLNDLGEEEKKDLSKEKKTFFVRDLLMPLTMCCILPATQASSSNPKLVTEQFLVPLKMGESVLDFKDCGQSSEKLVKALKCLGLPELDSVILSTVRIGTICYTKLESYNLARNLVATLKRPHSLLTAFHQKLKANPSTLDGKLEDEEAMEILNYFSRNTKSLLCDDKETLRRLPFFPMAGERLGKVQDRNVFVLPSDIPNDGIDVVEFRLDCFFVESRESLSALYEFLEFVPVSPSNVYRNFILTCFQQFSFEGKLAHLRYLHGFVSSVSAKENESEGLEKRQLVDYLKRIELIPAVDGSLKTASSFYDPCNEVFDALLPQDSFPPEQFNSEEWLSFLQKIGLTKDVSGKDFLKFANQVAHEAKSQRTENTYKKSAVLLQHLFSRPNVVGEGLLHLVSEIPFVAARPVEKSLQELCLPFGITQGDEIPFIAFKDSVVNEHAEIVWTKAHLLPTSADPRFHSFELSSDVDQYIKVFVEQLGIQIKPSVALVISHCQTVSTRKNITTDQCSTVTRVMERIYEFLQANAINDPEARRVLETMRFIAVEEGKKFILPTQAVIELYEHFEIKPFLYRIPAVFGKFQTLFEFVGCSKTVTCRDYAVVLEMMHEKCKGSKLNPNELTKCSTAIRGFFKALQDDPRSVLTLSKLYLPAMPSEFCLSNEHLKISTIPVTLRLSTELLFDDAPTYGYRIKGLEQPFVLELSLLNVSRKSAMINFTDLMLKLPPEVQPSMLSSVVKEKLCDPEKTKIVANGAVDTMKVKISSIPFARGVARIIKHVNHQDRDFDLSVLRGIEESLRSIDLFAVEGLRTSLFLYEVQIPESEADVPFLVDKPELSALGKSKVYIDTLFGVSNAIPIISDIIGEMYGEFLQKKAHLIGEMLRCPPSSIWPLLDRMKVRKDDSYTTADLYIYPERGTLIPIEDHHLLKEAFVEFEAGEYVGYQLHDPSLAQREGTPTYIYAIIVEEINSEDTVILTKAYRINIEHDKEAVEVSAGRLYKFHRLQEIFEEQDEDMDGVLKEISDILQNAWEMPEDERTQIVKRLFMRWFPRKDALQHLMNEVSRLGGGYDDLFALLEERVKRRDSQRKKYEEDCLDHDGPWPPSPDDDTPPIFFRKTRKNPQPEEAKRWLRQADADLESCSRERASTTDSFEWLCFKCHQVKSINIYLHCKRKKWKPIDNQNIRKRR